MIRLRAGTVLVLALAALGDAGAGEDAVAALLDADRRGAPLPLASRLVPGLDLAGAYRLQSRLVLHRLGGAAPAGFKAGLTEPRARARYGLDEPFAGVLYPGTAMASGEGVVGDRFPGLMVEVELGYLVDCELFEAIDTARLAQCVRAVVPVVELPQVHFADPQGVRGVDIIAANTGSALFLRGEPLPPGMAPEVLEVTLVRDGEVLLQAPAGAGQDGVLRWLVNKVIALGWTLEPGQLLITGALGRPLPAAPGRYRAQFRAGGELVRALEFHVF